MKLTKSLARMCAQGKSFLAFIKNRIRKDVLLLPSLVILAAFFFFAAFAGFVAPHPYDSINLSKNLAPVGEPGYPLGTDFLGRDILSRLIYGTQIVLRIIFLTTIIVAGSGITLGVISGFRGGIVDAVISRAIDILLAFPTMLFALTIVVVIGRGLDNAIIAVSIPAIAKFARIVKSSTLVVKESTHVEISKMMGASTFHVIREHVLPSIMTTVLVQIIINISVTLLAVSGLSFLGLGVEPPQPEWGAMISENRGYLREAPHTIILPGLAIFLIVLAWNCFGEALTAYLQPRWKERA
jgi:peptide/nickel transport system permease protein